MAEIFSNTPITPSIPLELGNCQYRPGTIPEDNGVVKKGTIVVRDIESDGNVYVRFAAGDWETQESGAGHLVLGILSVDCDTTTGDVGAMIITSGDVNLNALYCWADPSDEEEDPEQGDVPNIARDLLEKCGIHALSPDPAYA